MRLATSIAVVVLSFPLVAAAAGTMKPGLWEVTVKSDMAKQMPDIPPAQLEQMRKMGIEMPVKRDGALVQKMCITKEMAERDQPPIAREQSDCKVKNQVRNGNSYRADLVCDGPNIKGTGVIKGNFDGSERYTSTYDFKGTAHGREMNQHHEGSGKWLSSDCGNVRPMTEMMGGGKKK